MECLRTAACWVVVVGVTAVAGAQSPQQPSQQGGCYMPDASGKQVFVPNCGLDKVPERKTPTTNGADPSKQFPFPGETPSQPTAASQPAGQQGNGQVQGAAPNGTSGSNPAQAFPFPGEDKTPLVKPDGSVVPAGAPSDGAGPLKDAGSSGQSTSDSSSSSSSSDSDGAFGGLPPVGDDDKGPLADDDTVIKKPHKKAPPEHVQTADEREAEDLSVASFYMNDLNYRGAYLRAADAVATTKDDPDAHLALADAARKLGKLDEALAEYKKTLTLDPVPKTKKAAEKAISEMK